MEISGKFVGGSKLIYECIVAESFITEKDHVIKKFKGVHENGKSHGNVRCVWFCNTIVNFFPRGLEKHFSNLTRVEISSCGIMEISKDDLKGLEKLTGLFVTNCKLTALPDDLFDDMPNLREISFGENDISILSSELFKPLLGRPNLRADFRYNNKINAQYWPEDKEETLDSFEELMRLIDEKCTKPALRRVISDPVDFNPIIKEMWISGKFSDLTIIADDKKFKVHKAVLGMQSKVFADIFRDQSEATELKISDFSSETVEALIHGIYTNETTRNANALDMFKIADKFKVMAIKNFYENYICLTLKESNAWDTFMLGHQYKSHLMKKKSFEKIASKFEQKVPEILMEVPKKLKQLLEARQVCDEILASK